MYYFWIKRRLTYSIYALEKLLSSFSWFYSFTLSFSIVVGVKCTIHSAVNIISISGEERLARATKCHCLNGEKLRFYVQKATYTQCLLACEWVQWQHLLIQYLHLLHRKIKSFRQVEFNKHPPFQTLVKNQGFQKKIMNEIRRYCVDLHTTLYCGDLVKVRWDILNAKMPLKCTTISLATSM